MLNRRPSQIRWQPGKSQVEIIFCPVLFRFMHQMLRRVKTFLNVVNLWKFFPAFRIYLNQITDSRAINPQGMANRNILFFYFYTITGCNLHTIISLSFLFWISVFCCFCFLQSTSKWIRSSITSMARIWKRYSSANSCSILLHSVSSPSTNTFFGILYTRQDDTGKSIHILCHMKVYFPWCQIHLFPYRYSTTCNPENKHLFCSLLKN